MCGGSRAGSMDAVPPEGLSPRVRGKRVFVCRHDSADRSIPACAGEANFQADDLKKAKVYPRVCGGSTMRRAPWQWTQGLSPRVRGKRRGVAVTARVGGSIPACAGEARFRPPAQPEWAVYPRVCGGSGFTPMTSPRPRGLSPRVRGKPTSPASPVQRPRSIPACAGEALGARVQEWAIAVYPRVCGGSAYVSFNDADTSGLSPRVRGKPGKGRGQQPMTRSIPACAGEAKTDSRFI